jgi:outer membrane protein assembly factor BamB
VALGRTTRCCCTCLSIIAATLTLGAQPPAREPFGLFPLREAWNLPLGAILGTTPAFSQARGYFPLADGRIASYDLRDGTRQWIAPGAPISEPATGDGLLFIVEAGSLAALDEQTGAVRWRLPFAEALAVPLVWDNKWLIAATSSGTLLAFRGSDGHLVWRRDLGANVSSPPALAADRVYVSSGDGRVHALQVETGEPLWATAIGGSPGGLAARDDRIYAGSNDNYLYCLLAKDGTIDWRWMTGGDIVGRPLVLDDRVYVAALDNILRALDRKSGVQQWKRGLDLRPTKGPVAAGDVLIVGGVGTTLPAFRMATGAPAGEIAAAALLYAAPHVTDAEGLPMVTLVLRDIAQGTIVRHLVRSIDPAVTPVVPLANPIMPPAPATPGAPETAEPGLPAPPAPGDGDGSLHTIP